MRIAVFEPSPRVCGPTIWARHLRQGFRDLEHHCDIVAVTLSGKPSTAWGGKGDAYTYGFHWASYTPDVTVSPKTAEAIFNGYDLIILAEPKCAPLDRNVYRKEQAETPLYIEALAKTKTPWTTFLHGPQYGWELAPFLETMFKTGNFTGHIFTPQLAYAQPENRFEDYKLHVMPCLPYVPTYAVIDNVPRTGIVGFGGRAVVNKGPQLLVELARSGAIHADVEIWGASAVGVGPSMTRSMMELLKSDGWETTLVYDELRHKPDVLRPHRWVATKGDQRVSYKGNYTPKDEVFKRMQVHVNLTSVDFSFGLIEYVGLEALDAGCVGVYPPHTLGAAPYLVQEIKGFTRPPAITQKVPPAVRMDKIDPAVVEDLLAGIYYGLNMSEDQQRTTARANRQIIREYHDPKKLAAMVLATVMP